MAHSVDQNGQFVDQISQYPVLTLIGLCKNAGKTTALGHILKGLSESGPTLGLTSIGRDGEGIDRVTGTEKPGIFVLRGTLIATAAGLLKNCDVTREILATTGFSTPLGEVVLVRALSDGHIDLAGPSMVDQLVALRRMFADFGAARVLIDGALGRKTQCSRRLSDATVLCVGASCGRDMAAVARQAGHVCRLLGLPELSDPRLDRAMAAQPDARILLVGRRSDAHAIREDATLTESVNVQGDTDIILVNGAITDSLVLPLARSAAALEGVTLAARDAGRILIGETALGLLTRRGVRLGVLEGVRLAAVTVNPFSAYGHHFDPAAFREAVAQAVDAPVYDLGRTGD